MYRDKILSERELDVLRFLRNGWAGDAIIAGGAVRDFILNKPYKDIDIWFSTRDEKVTPQRFLEITMPKELSFKMGKDFVDIPPNMQGEPGVVREVRDELFVRPARADVLVVGRRDAAPVPDSADDLSGAHMREASARGRAVLWQFSFYLDGTQYQVMQVSDDPIKFMEEEFDIGLCKAYHDGKEIVRSKAFEYDLKHKTFTIDGKALGSKNFDWSINRHLPRLKALYPDFKERIITKPAAEKKKKKKATLDFDEISNWAVQANAADGVLRGAMNRIRNNAEPLPTWEFRNQTPITVEQRNMLVERYEIWSGVVGDARRARIRVIVRDGSADIVENFLEGPGVGNSVVLETFTI